MKFGILFRPQDPPQAANIVGRWQEILAAARVAEEVGFDGLFVPEHHMMPDGYLPSPWAALGALAAITEHVEIGTTIHLLPFEHPIHVAEHGAMVDVISNGRLRLGCGLGNFPDGVRAVRPRPHNTGVAFRRVHRDRAARLGR
jgi:alkanesulfonate monooxygenase SsuD/methylene tetrahydromethanopterin reductase-like flavin-dependent oxidoreductase (luciferase family)